MLRSSRRSVQVGDVPTLALMRSSGLVLAWRRALGGDARYAFPPARWEAMPAMPSPLPPTPRARPAPPHTHAPFSSLKQGLPAARCVSYALQARTPTGPRSSKA